MGVCSETVFVTVNERKVMKLSTYCVPREYARQLSYPLIIDTGKEVLRL